jgi:hypothetical protein
MEDVQLNVSHSRLDGVGRKSRTEKDDLGVVGIRDGSQVRGRELDGEIVSSISKRRWQACRLRPRGSEVIGVEALDTVPGRQSRVRYKERRGRTDTQWGTCSPQIQARQSPRWGWIQTT